MSLGMKKSSDLLVSEFVDRIILVYRANPSEHENSAAHAVRGPFNILMNGPSRDLSSQENLSPDGKLNNIAFLSIPNNQYTQGWV